MCTERSVHYAHQTHQAKSMKAIVCTQYGLPDVLRLEDVAQPVAEVDEVLIEVRAAFSTTPETTTPRTGKCMT